MDDQRWVEVVDRARAVLAEVAAGRSTTTYDDVRRRLGVDLPHRGEGDLAAVLRSVAVASDDEGRGLLSAVVVGPSGRPGRGWFRLAETRGRPAGSEPERMWREELERVWAAYG